MTQASPRIVTIRSLLEAGAHFGHQTKRWNPKMRQYIFTARNGIHIIDLQKTVQGLTDAYEFITQTVASGEKILFVGTKKQAQEVIAEEATRGEQLYITQRWLGGTLTNFVTIRKRLRYLAELEAQRDRGDFTRLTKAEGLKREEEIEKLNRVFGGIKTMERLPGALFIVDPHEEDIAVREAIRVNIRVVAMVDTNCNPDVIDYVVPCNDDAIRSIRLITSKIADAALDGVHRRESRMVDDPELERARA
ncbi:MAG: 30S ribosomal protein S2 [Chloroflexaceae bacterium]|nr:30S ribosomal protein S2 [Chloroflexaceae bacterium]NJL33903.1 30S ribosomal protein S2 [Chloroflexaceae bacterium]NJO07644.1 30S ribosomal protein S2 [Chloroflexaceae bacterium]